MFSKETFSRNKPANSCKVSPAPVGSNTFLMAMLAQKTF
jgi:hypothetical protein